jgi:hypothetical protein
LTITQDVTFDFVFGDENERGSGGSNPLLGSYTADTEPEVDYKL